MPAKSKQQYLMIMAKRHQYGKAEQAPENMKWVFDDEWTDVDYNKLPEGTYSDLTESKFFCYLKAIDNLIPNNNMPLLESTGITYYELRQLLTIFYKSTNDKSTKNVIGELIKILTKRELRKIPIPPIKKLKSISPTIFGD